ncbi:Protein kinase domain-containing protein, partial [Psidium guajava]
AVADMLSVVTAYNSKDISSPATRSTLGFGSPNTKADTLFSLSTSEEDPFYLLTATTRDVMLHSSRIHLNPQQFHQETKIQAALNPSVENTNHQLVRKASNSNIEETLLRASATPMEPKRKSYSGPLKTKSEVAKGNNLKAANTAPAPARRSVDSSSLWPKAGNPQLSKELITRKDPSTCHDNQPPAVPSLNIPRISSVRRAVSLSIKHPPTPPPLCSVCKLNAPHFGKAPRKFSYKEVERATNGFAAENFLAEGGFGPVYRGVLPDGEVIAVKQHKFLSAQGASEFCSEIEVLSCAQHKNLVMLVGYCIETEWLLIYEFACNGSLDKHLYGKESPEVLTWPNRMKVAMGAARGLRYLHEDCRVGCIIHRDFRPNNILLTHDFEPMVGDFGLARWQADGQAAEETRVVGAFGYLAPEYTQTGLITEKADVYAYGIVLLELLSGFKATEFSRSTGKQFVSDWASLLTILHHSA